MDLVGRKLLAKSVFSSENQEGTILEYKHQDNTNKTYISLNIKVKFKEIFGVLGREVEFFMIDDEVIDFQDGKLAKTISGLNSIQLLDKVSEEEHDKGREEYNNWAGAKNYFNKQELDAINASLKYIVNKEDFSSETNKLLFERTINKVEELLK